MPVMTGYEKSRDYGGPPPTRLGVLVLVAVIAALCGLWLWLLL